MPEEESSFFLWLGSLEPGGLYVELEWWLLLGEEKPNESRSSHIRREWFCRILRRDAMLEAKSKVT